jgi:hypothetical protein
MKLEESVRMAVRQLDNLIDINKLPIPEAEKSDKENRAIGLGVMGFSDTIEQLGMSYDSEHAWDFADRIFEFISYMAIDESPNLPKPRSYTNISKDQSGQKARCLLILSTVLERTRGRALTVSKESKHKRPQLGCSSRKSKEGHAQCNTHGCRSQCQHWSCRWHNTGHRSSISLRSFRAIRFPENISISITTW